MLDPPREGAMNMALDHALAVTVETGTAWLRLYRWERPTLSFGRNEAASRLYDLERARGMGFGLVRRPTGGRAVLHDAELTYSVVMAITGIGGLRDTYRRIHRGLAAGLCSLGVPAELDESGDAVGPDAGPCFREPAPGEIVARGSKLVGSAQARIGEAILQHGSILIDGTQAPVAELRTDGMKEVRGTESMTLTRLLGRTPSWAEVGTAITGGLAESFGIDMEDGAFSRAATTASVELEERYNRGP